MIVSKELLPLPSWDWEIDPFGLLLPNPGGPLIKQMPMIIKRIRIVPHRHAIRTMMTVGANCWFCSFDIVSITLVWFPGHMKIHKLDYLTQRYEIQKVIDIHTI